MSHQIERIGVIGDIHAEHISLENAIRVLKERGVDIVLATGDIADGKGSLDACCALLEAHGVVTVCGNHDRWLLAGTARNLPDATAVGSVSNQSRSFLERLPRMVELRTIAGLALLCHGLGANDMAKVSPDDLGYALDSNDDLQKLIQSGYFRWVINGHSHRKMVRAFPGLTIVNAGTIHRDHSPGFLEIDFQRKVVSFFELSAGGVPLLTPTEVALE
jgi:predicted phosphodiesterase